MAAEIKTLSPAHVWSYFYDLTQIPRPTFHTEAVQEYLLALAKRLNLEAQRDATGNILIRKPATPGLEGRPVVTLQAHIDMVPQKNSHIEHDFIKDPIDAYIDGEWVTARDTTLGADNGIGAAYMMAVLSDDTLKHGPLEALFTVDEEVGMVGANGLQPGFSKGDILINLDSEDEGLLFAGCAGGLDVNVKLEYKDQEPTPEGDIAVCISLTGLRGGHSGMDIILGRANANKQLVRFLKEAIASYGARLVHLEGGSARNAIPREAFALVTIPEAEADGLWEFASDFLDTLQTEYKNIEDGISLSLEHTDLPKTVIPEEIQDGVIGALDACINGVQSMLTDFPGIVESSTNMAKIFVGEGTFTATFMLRSSSESRKEYVASQIESAMNLAGAEVEFAGAYNGWAPNAASAVLKTMRCAYEEVTGKSPEITVVHAGLECGIIQGVMPDMDMISIGPDLRSPHSPDEKVHIASVERTWKVLVKALELI
jgi:Xaa-His dipeptidase